ncbi:MAG: PBP1A family penicillin-binding protein [Pseudomonadota bacterium]
MNIDPLDNDPFRSRRPEHRRFGFLELDAWIDSTMYRLGDSSLRAWDSFRVFMDRFGVSGATRFSVEMISDAATFAVLGGLIMTAFARPAFEISASTDWQHAQDYAVVFLDRAGNEIGKRGVLHSSIVPLEEMPDYLIKATLATEDRRFYEHFGIDITGTARALVENIRANGVSQGGSSLSQQLAKNLFLTNERSLERKIKEAFLAFWLETHLSKQEILRLYFDRAYMGGGAFGVEAAAQFYFGKSVRDVTLAEAAMMAGLFKAPTKFAPHVNLPAARARANVVLSNLVDAGYMSEGQVYEARRNPAVPVNRAEQETPDYFLDWAFEEVKGIVGTKAKVVTVKTTLDTSLQRKAEDSIESSLRQSGSTYRVRQGALVCLESDGSVRAMVGGRDYGASQFNRATEALRQPGSSFKPFVYAAAMVRGMTPNTVVPDLPITIGNWSPQNYTRSYMGPVTLTTALMKSLNTVAVRLAGMVGRENIVDLAHKMGVKSELKISRALPLGAAEVTVLDMATAYTVFQSGGKEVKAHGIVEIRDGNGEIIYRFDRDSEKPKQVMTEKAAKNMNYMLSQVVEKGTAQKAQLAGVQAAGKTGTTNAYRDAWFVGFTGNYSTAVWFGNDDYQPMNRMTGGTLPAATWHEYMTYAHAGIDLKNIPGLSGNSGARPDLDLLASGPAQGLRSFALTPKATGAIETIENRLVQVDRQNTSAAQPEMPAQLSTAAPEEAKLVR